MRDRSAWLLNNVSRPECYEEAIIESNSAPVALSVWKSNREDPCVVFFPGTMTHPLFYEEFLDLIALQGFNVMGVHPVGHGKSPRVKKIYSFDEMLKNGSDAISFAIERFNDNVVLMGSSQGGILAIALAGLDQRIKAVYPHNILIPELSDSVRVTRFPAWFRNRFIFKSFVALIRVGAKLFPGLQIPLAFYLEEKRISESRKIFKKFYSDPIGLTSYPLYFLSSLFNADLRRVYDGSIKCPVVVIADRGDPLFPFDYTMKVFDMIRAPRKEMLVFNENRHLIMNESPEKIIDDVVKKLREYT